MSHNISIDEAVHRIQALNQFAEETGQPLPYRADFILTQELRGHTVDLITGEIVIGAGDNRFRPTASGAAAAGDGDQS